MMNSGKKNQFKQFKEIAKVKKIASKRIMIKFDRKKKLKEDKIIFIFIKLQNYP